MNQQTQNNLNKKENGTPSEDKWPKERIKIFILESLREPFEELKEMIINLWDSIQKPTMWKYVGIIATIICIFRGNKIGAIISLTFAIIMDRYQQWKSGYFIEKYRKRKYKKFYKN